MSISATSCHYYRALSVSGAPSLPNLISIFAFVKPGGTPYRTTFGLSTEDTSERRQVALQMDSNPAVLAYARYYQSGASPQANSGILFNNGTDLSKWAGAAAWFDLSSATACEAAFVGRSVAPAVAVTKVEAGAGWTTSPANVALNNFFLARRNGWLDGETDATCTDQYAHVAVWVGYKLTTADVQSMVDGTNPQDIGTGYLEYYWPLEDSGDGLTDAIGGVTLAPFGGSATTTWHAADNPTVNAPTGSSQLVTVANVAQSNTVTGVAVYQAAPNGTLTTAPLKNNARTLLANISGWTVDVKNPTTGALVVRVTGLTTSALGVLTVQDALIITGQSYALDPIHATYGRVTPVLTAT